MFSGYSLTALTIGAGLHRWIFDPGNCSGHTQRNIPGLQINQGYGRTRYWRAIAKVTCRPLHRMTVGNSGRKNSKVASEVLAPHRMYFTSAFCKDRSTRLHRTNDRTVSGPMSVVFLPSIPPDRRSGDTFSRGLLRIGMRRSGRGALRFRTVVNQVAS